MRTLIRWAAVCWIAGVVWAAACVTGCAKAPDVLDAQLAADGARHTAELAECRKLKPTSAYQACADAADARALDGGR